ncbi:putative enzyme related to lactoylglutathione lyase [Murinocardiopsis flavida]|uniref:Putative enzyme related to lactoylglutathione lyase n=1 Tax=Murinocardiopsis flavida TaxID=645275 RepID=A0A2P8DTN2_9ACTN|nr:VOC family protein [Murinocardiopsis flavida]PSL00577.1 putative enzyme related to lactoylglutathione lyase [Murinocardiopsis flavida]
MTDAIRTIIYPVRDHAAAKALFSALLDARPQVDTAYYTGFAAEGQDIGLDPNGHAKGMAGPVCYVHVDDIEGRLGTLLAAGAAEVQAIEDVGGGKLTATVRDPDGNVIGLVQPRL